jgi:2-C-methyl-D-erythritol 4-phosphate cytidylyltransferase/2-C-methyl-D-erythritol 2,4-cyclodiphosphate synthase
MIWANYCASYRRATALLGICTPPCHGRTGNSRIVRTVAAAGEIGDNAGRLPGDDQGKVMAAPERLPTTTLVPRVGTGFDVHVLTEGRKLMLCGVEVPHDRGLAGHSDADVGIHALCDAIYGALAEGDIGRHFPPWQAAWKNADSARFLAHAAARIAERGGVLVNADVTLICERPKIAPHAARMVARLAEILAVPPGRVSVKATTTERLGFTGRMEGIAAQAAVSVLLPFGEDQPTDPAIQSQ